MKFSVSIVLYPEFKLLEATGPLSVFNYANSILESRGMNPVYNVFFTAVESGSIMSDNHISLEATIPLNSISASVGRVILLGSPFIEMAVENNPEIIRWLRSNDAKTKELIALCSGSFFLAEAGILDGIRATTHWRVSEKLQEKYPRITVDSDAIFIKQGRIWTSAGVTASIDLALSIIENDFGREIALDVARELVVYLKRPGGQSQFSSFLLSGNEQGSLKHKIKEWVFAHPQENINIHELANAFAMSERNFMRTLKKQTGLPPSRFIENTRIELARQLLEASGSDLKKIAYESGFSSQEHMRRAFKKRVGISPTDYRSRFSSTVNSEHE